MFRDVPTLQVLECSGDAVEAGLDLLSMTIYLAGWGRDTPFLVSVNLRNGECSIAENTFSMCDVNTLDSRKTSLQTLVSNPEDGKSRLYGCNATVYQVGGRTHTMSWFLTVVPISK